MHHLLKGGKPYARRQQHLDLVLDYAGRTHRVRYEAADFRRLLQFLAEADLQTTWEAREKLGKLQMKLVKKARKKFPDEPYFHCRYGQIEVERGPNGCNGKQARRAFQQALELLQNRQTAEAVQLAKTAKQGLERLEDFQSPQPQFCTRVPDPETARRLGFRMEQIVRRLEAWQREAAGTGATQDGMPDDLFSELAQVLKEARQYGLEMPPEIESIINVEID